MKASPFEEISDWSSEEQSATEYRRIAARARKLLADATTPRVKLYLDKIIAHCEKSWQAKSIPTSRPVPKAGTRLLRGRREMMIDFHRNLTEVFEKNKGRRC